MRKRYFTAGSCLFSIASVMIFFANVSVSRFSGLMKNLNEPFLYKRAAASPTGLLNPSFVLVVAKSENCISDGYFYEDIRDFSVVKSYDFAARAGLSGCSFRFFSTPLQKASFWLRQNIFFCTLASSSDSSVSIKESCYSLPDLNILFCSMRS